MLYYDGEGQLQSHIENCMAQWDYPVASDGAVYMDMTAVQAGPAMHTGGGVQTTGSVQIHTLCQSGEILPMITQLQLGELVEPLPNRPSLILQRPGERTLWELAKANGSTVEAISKANQLMGEPEPEQMLLIPVR